jgi:rubrerythrin
MTEGTGYKRMKAQSSLEDILAVATEFERTARDFYSALAPKVSKQIRYLVEELAAEEQRHFDLFTELQSRSDIGELVKQDVDTPASDRRFSDCIHVPELGEKPDDQAVLQYALGREHAAMEQYRSLADSTPAGPIKDLFNYLANEETEHKSELEKVYYEVVHSGGV